MEKLITLTGKQIRLLLKIEYSTQGFQLNVANFLDDNSQFLDDKTTELQTNEKEFYDIIDTVRGYLASGSISEEYKVTEEEKVELQEFIDQLNSKKQNN